MGAPIHSPGLPGPRCLSLKCAVASETDERPREASKTPDLRPQSARRGMIQRSEHLQLARRDPDQGSNRLPKLAAAFVLPHAI